MQLKDYYTTLHLNPSATLSEIKKAYRILAQKYHPDKNNNDAYAASQFSEIKEAYEVLTNSLKKQYYLQQRWYHQSLGKKFKTETVINPPSVLKQCLELSKYVSTLDKHRMDKEGLADYILQIIPDNVIQQLKTFNEPSVERSITGCLLKLSESLRLNHIQKIYAQLLKLAEGDHESKNAIETSLKRFQRKERLEQLQPLIIILITIIISLLIYFMSR